MQVCPCSPVRYETPLTKPFLPGMSLWKTEWLMIISSREVSSQELWITKSRFFSGDGHDTEKRQLYVYIPILERIRHQTFVECLSKGHQRDIFPPSPPPKKNQNVIFSSPSPPKKKLQRKSQEKYVHLDESGMFRV